MPNYDGLEKWERELLGVETPRTRSRCTHCNKYFDNGEMFHRTEYGDFCEYCHDDLSITIHKVLVTLVSGLTYTSENASFNSAWIDAIKFIVDSGEEVNQTVSYRIRKFEGEKYYVQKS